MYKGNTKLLLMNIMFFVVFVCKGQDVISVKFIGNCGLQITDGITNIYTDFPYKSGAYGYMTYDETEIDNIKENSMFVFTHKHADHYSRKHIRHVVKNKNGIKFTQGKIKKLLKYTEAIPDFDLQVFRNKHRFALKHNSYLITWHGKKIFLSGDTESAETIRKMKDLDWAFVPPWILFDAKEKNIEIDAQMIGVYHLYPSEITEAKEEWKNDNNITPLIKQGQTITIKLN